MRSGQRPFHTGGRFAANALAEVFRGQEGGVPYRDPLEAGGDLGVRGLLEDLRDAAHDERRIGGDLGGER